MHNIAFHLPDYNSLRHIATEIFVWATFVVATCSAITPFVVLWNKLRHRQQQKVYDDTATQIQKSIDEFKDTLMNKPNGGRSLYDIAEQQKRSETVLMKISTYQDGIDKRVERIERIIDNAILPGMQKDSHNSD